MAKLIELLAGFLLVWILVRLYKAYTSFLYARLKQKLANKNLQAFKEELGNNYEYREMGDGLTRYKWSKGLVVIRANFNEQGQLVSPELLPYEFFNTTPVISFG